VIELRNLTVGYGAVPVLSGVNLELRPGEVLVLAGPNGCGKSTLIRTVLGMQPALGGEIRVDDVRLNDLTNRQIAQQMTYLAQSRNVPNITAYRMVLHGRFPYLSYPRTYREEDRRIALEALERTGALELADRPMNQLSGGQRQSVYLAMALAQDTQTVFLDEPTTYLDVRSQLDVMNMARTLAQQGKAVVLVLHDLCLAMRSADRVAVLGEGRLQCAGTPEEVFEGGVLDRVFGIPVRRVATETGWQYYYG